jgi:hypothetical protein
MNWYYDIEGRSNGPVTESSLKRMAREGEISVGTLLWHPGLEEWGTLAKLQPEIAELLNKVAASLPLVGKTGSIPPLTPKTQEDKGGIKKFFGWGKKK